MKLIESLKWRYATKKMDANQKVSDEDIASIKEAIRLSASSYGLQPYKVIEIKNPELRAKLQPLCWNQSQITEASHLFVFCNQLEISDEDVDQLIKLNASTNGIDESQLTGYGDFMKLKLKEKSTDEVFHWTAKQAYIALGSALVACAELRIDSTPMEGFETDQVNELLGTKAENLNACALLAVGYRSKDDAAQHGKKVRKAENVLFETR